MFLVEIPFLEKGKYPSKLKVFEHGNVFLVEYHFYIPRSYKWKLERKFVLLSTMYIFKFLYSFDKTIDLSKFINFKIKGE